MTDTPEQRIARWLDEQNEAGFDSLKIAEMLLERLAPKTPWEAVEALTGEELDQEEAGDGETA